MVWDLPREQELRVVIDTNVVVDHYRAEDSDASAAIVAVKKACHEVVACEKLLREYRKHLSNGSQQMYSLVDLFLLQVMPGLRKYPDPEVRIAFGPVEDRFHMQLAIDKKAGYHVSKDKGVLAAAGDMMLAGAVKVCGPRDFVVDCSGFR